MRKLFVEFYKRTKKLPIEFKEPKFDLNIIMLNAFKMPPKKAMEYLQAKGIVTTDRWDELSPEMLKKSFTVSKVASADLLQDILDKIIIAREQGQDFKEFQSNCNYIIEKAGWLDSRLNTIYSTNMGVAYSQGILKSNSLIAEKYPYWCYMQIERPTKRHDHSLYHKKAFHYQDPIWQKIYPPSGFGCKCTVTPMTKEEALANGFQIMSGSDFGDVPEADIKMFEQFKPDVDKYVSGIKEQLQGFLK